MQENRFKILIVDDDDSIRSFMIQMLARSGFIVEEAVDGLEGLEKVHKNKPDIIILDGSMPGLDGPGMFRILREDPETRDIPVIFCTSSCVLDDVRDIATDNVDYLRKPFACDELYDKINNMLEKKDLVGEI